MLIVLLYCPSTAPMSVNDELDAALLNIQLFYLEGHFNYHPSVSVIMHNSLVAEFASACDELQNLTYDNTLLDINLLGPSGKLFSLAICSPQSCHDQNVLTLALSYILLLIALKDQL